MIKVALDDKAVKTVQKTIGGSSMFDNWIMPTYLVANMLQAAKEAKQITKIDLLPLFTKYKKLYKNTNRMDYSIRLHRLEEFSEDRNIVVLKIAHKESGEGVCLEVSDGNYNTTYSTQSVIPEKGATSEQIIELVCKSISSEDLAHLVDSFINLISNMAGTGPNYVQRNVCMGLGQWDVDYPISMKDLFAVFGITLD